MSNLTWSWMKAELHCEVEDGKWVVYAAQTKQSTDVWQDVMADFISGYKTPKTLIGRSAGQTLNEHHNRLQLLQFND